MAVNLFAIFKEGIAAQAMELARHWDKTSSTPQHVHQKVAITLTYGKVCKGPMPSTFTAWLQRVDPLPHFTRMKPDTLRHQATLDSCTWRYTEENGTFTLDEPTTSQISVAMDNIGKPHIYLEILQRVPIFSISLDTMPICIAEGQPTAHTIRCLSGIQRKSIDGRFLIHESRALTPYPNLE